MPSRHETIVIGAGQAGLSVSHHLSRLGLEHIVLERGAVGDSWLTKRWDGFYLNTPKFTQQLPGYEYDGPEPEAFSSLAETIAYLEGYAASFSAPVRTGVEVLGLRSNDGELEIDVKGDVLRAKNVVVTTGAYPAPAPTPLAELVAADVFQLHTDDYRRPDQLPNGATLIVGGGQSGCQIADELIRAGRAVYLSVGRCPWAPRRYRGREIVHWLIETGFYDQLVDSLPSPAARLVCNVPISGNDGGHDCHPRWLEARGATLLGRLTGVRAQTLNFAPDLEESFAFGDEIRLDVLGKIDGYIAEHGLDATDREPEGDWGPVRTIEQLDLREADITTVLWATGYRPAFGWIKLPLFDQHGWPVQTRGVTAVPGLYFVGLHWLHKRKSSLLFGVGEDAGYVASHLAARER